MNVEIKNKRIINFFNEHSNLDLNRRPQVCGDYGDAPRKYEQHNEQHDSA